MPRVSPYRLSQFRVESRLGTPVVSMLAMTLDHNQHLEEQELAQPGSSLWQRLPSEDTGEIPQQIWWPRRKTASIPLNEVGMRGCVRHW